MELPPALEPPETEDPVGMAFIEYEAPPAPALFPAAEAEEPDDPAPAAEETVSSDEPELAVVSLDPELSRSVRCSLESDAEDPLACGKAATLDTRPSAAIVMTDVKLEGRKPVRRTKRVRKV